MTDEDKELLRLAAKAGGYDIDPLRYDDEWGFAIRGTATFWNPNKSNDDAFQLGVVCGIKHKFNAGLGQAFAWNQFGHEIVVNVEDCDKCKFAAVRYAITTAAAVTWMK